jgi:hypothetical protein
MLETLAYFASCKKDEEMLQNSQFNFRDSAKLREAHPRLKQLDVKFEHFIPISVLSFGRGVAHHTQGGSFRPREFAISMQQGEEVTRM